MTKHSTSSQDSQTGLNEWEIRMAKLVGLDESSPADIENTLTADVNSQPQTDEATSSFTQQPLSANPFAKAGLVGAGTLAIVMFTGGFLSQVMSNDNPQLTQNTIRSQTLPQAQPLPHLQQLQEEVEGLKTKLALSQQINTVKAAQQKLRMVKPRQSTPRVKPKPTPQTKPPTIPRNLSMSRISRKPQPPQIRIVEVPKIVKVERIVNVPQPRSQPPTVSPPVAQKPKPLPVLPQIVPPPEPTTQPLVEIAPPPQPNPMEEWARLAKLGSYGQVSLNKNQTVSNRTSSQRFQVARKVEEKEINNKPEREIQARTARQSVRRNPKTIPVGNSAKAVLATLVYGETTSSGRRGRESRGNREDNENNNVYVVRLRQPLKAADGTVGLPVGSQILTKINSISESGLIQLEIVKIIMRENGKLAEKSVPQDALMIRGKKGKPLIAKQYPNKGSSIARRDAALFALGGLGKAAELINRTESEVVTGDNGTVAVTNVNRDPSMAAGILEGGMKAVVPQISRRNQRAISQMSRKTNIWFLPQGKEVEIFVNQEMQL